MRARWFSTLAMAMAASGFLLSTTAAAQDPHSPARHDARGTQQEPGKTDGPDSPHSMQAGKPATMGPRAFVSDALKSGRLEVTTAQAASRRARAEDVREFAQMLERDHTALNVRLESLAGADAAQAPPDAAAKQEAPMMAAKDGADPDRAYVEMQVAMHQEAIAKYEAASRDPSDPRVQQFARDSLPTLRQHATQAAKLQRSLTSKP